MPLGMNGWCIRLLSVPNFRRKDKPNADQALKLLQRTASLVKPIMRKHGWVLPVLSEFFPENPNLLGESSVCLLVASSAGC